MFSMFLVCESHWLCWFLVTKVKNFCPRSSIGFVIGILYELQLILFASNYF